MNEHKRAIRAKKAIKRYCKSMPDNCSGCVFFKNKSELFVDNNTKVLRSGCMFALKNTPYFWDKKVGESE